MQQPAVFSPVPQANGYVGRRADEGVRKERMVSTGAPSHEQLAAESSGAGSGSAVQSTTRPIIGSIGRARVD
jgi:hypothetical protein